MKADKDWIKIYWLGTMVQIFIICFVRFLLRGLDISYPEFTNWLFIVVGGASSALWGSIVAKKSGKVECYQEILLHFFGIRQPIKYYAIVFLFLVILFGNSLFTGKILEGDRWYSFLSIFMISGIFGGIEEIGWRYTFQPLLEKSLPYEVASVLTFLSWGLWHYMYFYIADSLSGTQHVSFLLGLLVSCFVLGAIYHVTHSLWLCVLYHCMLNMFSQTLAPNEVTWNWISSILCIILAIIMVRKKRSIHQN